MITENYQIYSAGSTQLYCTSWHPEEIAQAVLFIVHGLGEHHGRYEEMATKFVENKIAVFAFDHRGHGQSEGKRGHAESVEQLVEDVEHALMKCRSLFLDIPIFLFGHSMGGLVVGAYLDKVKSREISGYIITSPWIRLKKPPPNWQIYLAKKLAFIFPSFTLPTTIEADQISSVNDEVDQYSSDPLVHNKISVSLFKSMFVKGLYLLGHAQPCKKPVLICHGSSDMITDPEASKQYANLLGKNAAYKTWENSRHEPHHDFEKESVISYYTNWIKRQIA